MIKSFKFFHLTESRSFRKVSPIFEAESKEDSYRSIALKVAEIFSLFGFFFAQKPDFIKPGAWQKMMADIARVPDIDKKWDTIISLCKFLQQKADSPQMAPTQRGEFGFRGQYDYGKETEGLPRAAEYLKTASQAAMNTFSPAEKSKAMDILDRTLLSVKPFTLAESLVLEKVKYLPPTSTDLLRVADNIGSKLLRIYDDLEATKSAFPESETKIEGFLTGTVIPAVDEIKNMIQNEIPNVGIQAAEGYMKKLNSFDTKVDSIAQTAESIRSQMTQSYQTNYASKQYEDSAQKIIDEVKEGIRKQGLQNARWKKTGDVVAGTTDTGSAENTGDLQAQKGVTRKNIEDLKKKQRSRAQDLSKYLTKKYS